MGQRDDVRKFHRRLEELGCTVELGRRSGHYKVRRDGKYLYTLPGSSSDCRSLKQAKTDLRRLHGLDV